MVFLGIVSSLPSLVQAEQHFIFFTLVLSFSYALLACLPFTSSYLLLCNARPPFVPAPFTITPIFPPTLSGWLASVHLVYSTHIPFHDKHRPITAGIPCSRVREVFCVCTAHKLFQGLFLPCTWRKPNNYLPFSIFSYPPLTALLPERLQYRPLVSWRISVHGALNRNALF